MEEVSLRLTTLKNMLYSSKERDNVFHYTNSVPKKDELKQGFWVKRASLYTEVSLRLGLLFVVEFIHMFISGFGAVTIELIVRFYMEMVVNSKMEECSTEILLM